MALADRKRETTAGGARGDRTPQVNAVVAVQEIVLATPGQSTPDKDYMVVRLINPAFGKPEGTVLKARLREVKKSAEATKDRMTLLDHSRGKGMLKKLVPDNLYVLESSYLDKNGDINARWPTKIASGPNGDALTVVMPEVFAKVIRVRYTDDGQPTASQTAIYADLPGAMRVGGKVLTQDETALTKEQLKDDNLMASLANKPKSAALDDAILSALRDSYGISGFILRGVMDGQPDLANAISWTRKRSKPEGATEWVTEAPEQTLAAFKEKHAAWVQDVATDKDATWEVIPTVSINAGRATGEKAQSTALRRMKNDNVRYAKDDTSLPYYATRKDDRGEYEVSCYAPSVMVLQRMEENASYHFFTEVRPISREPEKYFDHEVPTMNLNEGLLRSFGAAATERGKYRPPAASASAAAQPSQQQQDPELETAGGPRP